MKDYIYSNSQPNNIKSFTQEHDPIKFIYQPLDPHFLVSHDSGILAEKGDM